MKETDPHFLAMQNAQATIHRTTSEVRLVRVIRQVRQAHKTTTYLSSTRTYPARFSRTKTNKDFLQIVQTKTQRPTQIQIKVAT